MELQGCRSSGAHRVAVLVDGRPYDEAVGGAARLAGVTRPGGRRERDDVEDTSPLLGVDTSVSRPGRVSNDAAFAIADPQPVAPGQAVLLEARVVILVLVLGRPLLNYDEAEICQTT